MPVAYAAPTPLPVSANQVLGYLQGLDRPLLKVARAAYPAAATDMLAIATLLAQAIRGAQWELQEKTRVPFFRTRFCTRELASQLSLALGTDYDEEIQPLDYDVRQWRQVSGRTQLPYMPIDTVEKYRLTLAHDGKIADVPADWLNRDDRHGQLHILPNALTSLSATFFTIFAIHPMLMRPGMGPFTPLLVHVQYSGGLCERTAVDGASPFDPDAETFNSHWGQAEVANYQQAIQKLAAAPILRKIAPALSRGGLSIGVDGLSRQANTQVLEQQAQALEQEARGWAWEKRENTVGVNMVFC